MEKLKPGRPGKMPALSPEQRERWLAARLASCGVAVQWKVARTMAVLAGEDQTRAREAAVTAFHEMIDQIWQLQDEVRAATGRQGRGGVTCPAPRSSGSTPRRVAGKGSAVGTPRAVR